jgi:hypothetical protein
MMGTDPTTTRSRTGREHVALAYWSWRTILWASLCILVLIGSFALLPPLLGLSEPALAIIPIPVLIYAIFRVPGMLTAVLLP